MDPVELARKLVAIDSVTSHSNVEIAKLQAALLEDLRFEVEQMSYRDLNGVEKVLLAAQRLPTATIASPTNGIAYFCHNDVVSVDGWSCEHGGPFDARVADGRLWGRGACDMKGPTASALAAVAALADATQVAPLYFFVTGDEECGMAGARLLMENSQIFRTMVQGGTVGIIGEPTELQVVNSHKGGCHFDVSSHGVAAHSSTKDGLNANWQLIPFLSYLRDVARRCETESTLQNSAFSTPTLSLNVVVENEPAAFNITVGRAVCRIFFRPMPDTDWLALLDEIKDTACNMELEVSSIRCLSPLMTPVERPFVQTALRLAGQSAPSTAGYATDGCCFDELSDLIVLGPGNIEQAHRHDEWISVQQLHQATQLYAQLFRHYAFEH